MHDGICLNPFDMSLEKFNKPRHVKNGVATRDLNPLGFPLKKETAWQNRQLADELLQGSNVNKTEMREKSRKILSKYAK